jgi:iron complex transport system permease protein
VAIFFNIGYSLTFWTAGGVAGIRADTLAMTAPFILAALVASWVLARRVTVLSLGEEAASGLGVNVGKSRTLCLLVVLVLAGAAVALAGPVAFVGLMVPHMVRRFVGSDYRAVIPASMVGGALFMLLADVLARTLMAPSEIPIGAIFAIVGVPFFIWCARREAMGLE